MDSESLEPFPQELMQRYKLATSKLTKFQRTLFKRFAPNAAHVADEFHALANQFADAQLPQYAALSWLGAAQSHKALGNHSAEVDYLLRSADASRQADERLQQLHVLGNDRQHLENALRCYNQALASFAPDSVFRAAIIRQIGHIQPHSEQQQQLCSGFASAAHRMHDLDEAAERLVRRGDYCAALDRRTEIYDDICERRVEWMYVDLLRANEITRVLLLLWLELPPARQSPSHVKLLAQFGGEGGGGVAAETLQMPEELRWALAELVRLSTAAGDDGGSRRREICAALDRLQGFESLSPEQRRVLRKLDAKAREYL